MNNSNGALCQSCGHTADKHKAHGCTHMTKRRGVLVTCPCPAYTAPVREEYIGQPLHSFSGTQVGENE